MVAGAFVLAVASASLALGGAIHTFTDTPDDIRAPNESIQR